MRKGLVFLVSVFLIFLTACGSGENGGTVYTEVNVEDGISFVLKEGTLKSSGATFILTNNTEGPINYSAHEYHFEQLKDGQWVEFTGTAQANWSEEAATLEAGQEVELSYVWKTFCGSTVKGTQYRLIILVNGSAVAVEITGI
ncbi:hypothetical protein CLNEO_04180 [Anaerotignum neopropionicum]|uniref:Bacterial Ig-like domain-containing protein n=1 Tax=Anaerotignum neopropionicum TaxID=36847 RepID=A0A136WIQ3_9FIRM|nr:immunoglobulin-like domain-containing protein [Anaerotignum neopropionicum]KXL54188.1 hypothetical protein CLNEO_02890 [Anaerotignum neopropionicum]KXL54313.1 hypothetical protein CLNEO_04180 [Anaerotignum neopropionicum]